METHYPFSKASLFWNRLGYEICALSEASGHSGGIWVRKSKCCNYDSIVIDVYFQAVTICIKKDGCMWFCSPIYGSPQLVNREKLWSYLIFIRGDILSLWVMIGDFNEVLLPSEIKGGIFTAKQAEKFSNMIEQCNLIDLGATRSTYTWTRKERGILKVAKRLDRALGDCVWRTTFPEAYVENLTQNYSDHLPILLRGVSFVPAKRVRSFRFQAAWLTHKDFLEVVYKAWDKGEHIVPASLEHIWIDATTFNKEVFGDIHKKKGTLAKKLKQVQHMLETVDSTHLIMTEVSLQKEYNDVLKQEEILGYQKSMENWVKLGDRNTSFSTLRH